MSALSSTLALPRAPSTSRRRHMQLLAVFAAVVLGHWVEHLLQAAQIWALGMPREQALGALGYLLPSLVESEWLHWTYNVLVLVGIFALLPGFTGTGRRWWIAAGIVQCWHFFEHALLLAQAQLGTSFFGAEKPTSVAQLLLPRVELHLLYNGVVTALLAAGFTFHLLGAVELRGRGGARVGRARS